VPLPVSTKPAKWKRAMNRQRISNRRASESISFECNGLRYVATISRFPDGRLRRNFPQQSHGRERR
jgi:hypothetical protein